MMYRYIMSTNIRYRILIALNLLSISDAYFGQSHVTLEDLNFIHLTEDGYDDRNPEGRLFFSNNTDLAAFAALSLFPLLFLEHNVLVIIWLLLFSQKRDKYVI